MPDTATQSFDVDQAVLERYKRGARAVAPSLCCPTTDYDGQYLKVLPDEILEKDYGCGDPSKYVGEGDTVVDLGSGAGKICYILAQKVGPAGRIIGVDFNDEMLELARGHHGQVTGAIGYDNVRFVKGRIQDLALSLDDVQPYLDRRPVGSVDDMAALEAECDRLRRERPMIQSDSVDAIVSNCVLNLVRPQHKRQLFAEMFRVLRRGGRAVISDVVCDEDPTPQIMDDPQLWSGCIAGAFREDLFLKMFEQAGFYGVEVMARAAEPWQVIDGIEFRSMTVRAYKGKQGECLERNQAVVYKGPWKRVVDDDGHTLHRGQRMAVCDKTFHIYTNPAGPYAGRIEPVEPHESITPEDAAPFQCSNTALRDPRQTKGLDYHETRPSDEAGCGPGECC